MPGDGCTQCPRPSADPPLLRLDLQGDPGAVRAALARLRCVLAPLAGSPERVDDIELVLAEVLNNIVLHAYGARPGPIAVVVHRTGPDVLCEVLDEGRPMPDGVPPAGAAARIDVPAAELPEGGFGWFLIRRQARSLRYCREGPVNRLTLVLPLGPGN